MPEVLLPLSLLIIEQPRCAVVLYDGRRVLLEASFGAIIRRSCCNTCS